MPNFDYCLIDAQWVLSRNYFAICKGNLPTDDEFPYRLVSSCVSSFMNMTNWMDIGKIILVFDTYPYFKLDILNGDYKSSRYYVTKEEAEAIEDEVERSEALIKADNFEKRSIAKKLLKNLSPIGLPSLWRPGYEADDLVYLTAQYLNKKGYSTILISVDSDWRYWLSPNSSIYNPKTDVIETESQVRESDNIPSDYSLFEWKMYWDSCYGSHNELYRTVNDLGWNEIPKILFDHIKLNGFTEYFSDSELAKQQIKSFSFKDYPDYKSINNTLEALLYNGHLSNMSKLAKFSSENYINLNFSKFTHYYETLNPVLFCE